MPLPLGHTAIGLATYELMNRRESNTGRLGLMAAVVLLTNLPDLDVLIGLILEGNGNLFHRGPTHSLLFALIAGYLASKAAKRWPRLPQLGFGTCFALVVSHILGDFLFTSSPVSLFWPFAVHWSSGFSTLRDVVHSVLFQGLQDLGIIMGSAVAIGLTRFIRGIAGRSRLALKN